MLLIGYFGHHKTAAFKEFGVANLWGVVQNLHHAEGEQSTRAMFVGFFTPVASSEVEHFCKGRDDGFFLLFQFFIIAAEIIFQRPFFCPVRGLAGLAECHFIPPES